MSSVEQQRQAREYLLKKFYKNRSKDAKLYDYDATGNLVIRNKAGGIDSTIYLPTYVKPTEADIQQMENERMEKIAKLQQDYELKFQELRNAVNASEPMTTIFHLNRDVERAEILLQATRFPSQYYKYYDKVDIKDILLDETYEKRKMPYSVVKFGYAPHTLQNQYVRIISTEETQISAVPGLETITDAVDTVSQSIAQSATDVASTIVKTIGLETGDATTMGETGKKTVKRARIKKTVDEPILVSEPKVIRPSILFYKPDNSQYAFLSPYWKVNIKINDQMYISTLSAILGEIALKSKDEDGFIYIQAQDEPAEIEYSYTDAGISEEEWNRMYDDIAFDVLLAEYRQHPELAQKLLQTGDAKLGFADSENKRSGIGMSTDNPDAVDAAKWIGENKFGEVLEKVRDVLKREKENASVQPTKTIRRKIKMSTPSPTV
jgi:ribA/ribD-fused uncharacterized protein